MSSGFEVAVVGGGVFGVTAALELARRGRRVALLDQGEIPHPDAASTDISKIVRLEYGADAFYMELMEAALAGWRALDAGWGTTLFHETGFLVLTSRAMEPGSFELESFDLLGRRGHRVERLDSREIVRRHPAWRPGAYLDGYYNPQGGWVESGAVVARLLQDALREGVTVRERAGVTGLIEAGGAVRGVATQGGPVEADAVVLACGAWTPTLVPELADALAVVGQPVLHFAPADLALFRAPALTPWAADISRTGWYGFGANAAGVVKVAHHGPGVAVDPRAARVVPEGTEARFRGFLREALPALADAPRAGSRLCLYSDSADGDPWITRHPDRSGLVIAAGGSGHGFKLAPILGGLVADAVEGRDGRFGHRFAWRTIAGRRFEAARFGGA